MRDLEGHVDRARVKRENVGLALREGYLDDLFFRVIACVSAFGDEKSIASVVLKTWNFVDAVVVCDDASSDLTCDIAESLGAIVVRHEVARGRGAAFRSCFDEALKYDPVFVVTLGGDGRSLPEEIPSLLSPLIGGEADVVVGVQGGVQSGFRAYSRDALEVVVNSDGFDVESDLLSFTSDNGLRVLEVPVSVVDVEEENESKQASSRGVGGRFRLLDFVVSGRPLVLVGLPGVVSLLICVFSLGVFLFAYFKTGAVSLPLAILCLASMVLGVMFILVALVLYALRELTVLNRM